ncbi:hypothetical protein R3P38DRAFT_2475346, partial [Favolaschia claudopus]
RRADTYQKQYYGTRKKLKRSHEAHEQQAAVLAGSLKETGRLKAQVSHLTAEVTQLEAESSSLRAEVASQKSARSVASQKMHAMAQKIRRIPSRIDTAVEKAATKAREEITRLFSFILKEDGVIPDSARDMINNLVALDGVRPNKVVSVLRRIAEKLGIAVVGNASDRSIRRIVKEGGVASTLQFVEAVGTAK